MNTTHSDYGNFAILGQYPAIVTPCLHVILHLALPQRLVEPVAKRQIVLVLGARQELLNLPRARTAGVRFCRGCSVLRSRSLGNRCRFLRVRAGEHAGHGVANGVTDGGTDRDSTSGGGHLGHQTGTLAGGGHRRSNGARWGVLDHRLGWRRGSGAWWWGRSGLTWGSRRWGSAGSRRRRSGPSTTNHFVMFFFFF